MMSLISSGSVAAVVGWYLNRVHEKVDRQAADIINLKDSRVKHLEDKIDDHLKSDRASIVDIAELKKDLLHVSKSMDKLYDVTARLADETAEQRQQLKDAKDYNRSLHEAIREVRNDMKTLIGRANK